MSTAEMINHELAARWEMCCEAVGIDTDATAAEWREAYEAKRAQVRREAAEPHLRAKWAEELERAMFKVESVHHFGFGYHGFKCLCGFESLRNRSRTEHITQAVRNLLEGAGE